MPNIVSVVVNRFSRNVDRIFDYQCSDEIFSKLQIGSMVYVPFGKGDGIIEAFVVGFPESSSRSDLKDIISVNEDGTFFNQELLSIALFMKDRYFSTLISSIKVISPPGVGLHFDKVNEKIIKGAALAIAYDEAFSVLDIIRDRAPMRTRVIELLIQNEFVSYQDILMITGCNRSVIKTLESKGIIRQCEIELYRNPIDYSSIKATTPHTPTNEQKIAIDAIKSAKKYKTFLLFGVTGSGKTEVFLQCIHDTIKRGKSALVLVPEIALTPQMLERFIGRFGKRVAVLHSRLSTGERFDEHRRIKNGEVDVVIGVRSAVFAPLSNLGLIVVDEEHEVTYKSEASPSYHAREVAEYRAQINNIPLVLSSATPDISSFYRTTTGEFELITLKNRTNNQELPEVKIIDMRKELIDGNRSVISNRLKNEIDKNIKNKEQTILFLNRRGFSTFVSCRSCGYVAKCDRCNISLTYHKGNNTLMCHYCGYTIKNLETCPSCQSKYIRHFGTGTQKVEEEIKMLFPDASVIRMDVDTTSGKSSHQQILDTFENNKTDIMIGTQMVTKGLDFPNVTLVGILAADLSLNLDDYHAGERTFDLITQVCGRAGRGKTKGRAILQTYTPENDILKLAKEQDYITFYKDEINLRRLLRYPPFCDIISLLLTSTAERAVSIYTQRLAKGIQRNFKKYEIGNAEILGPCASGLLRINNKFRWRILIKCNMNNKIREIINNLLSDHLKTRESKWITMHIELNPNNII